MEEKLPLLFVSSRRSSLRVCGSRWMTNVCIRSKAARLILLWNASILLGYKLLFDINTFMQVSHSTIIPIVVTLLLSMVAVVSPLAGILTDTKCSRHKAVLCSSYAMIVMLILIPILTVSTFSQRFVFEESVSAKSRCYKSSDFERFLFYHVFDSSGSDLFD